MHWMINYSGNDTVMFIAIMHFIYTHQLASYIDIAIHITDSSNVYF